MDARVRKQGARLRGEELSRHANQRGIQFDVVDALNSRMLERLGDAAVDAAADHENVPRRWVLQQRIVNAFFSGSRVRRVGEQNPVRVNAANLAGLSDGQVAID